MNINEYLKSLGDTADEVAKSLVAQGITGKRCSPCACPVIKGIYKAVPRYWAGLQILGGPDHYHATLNDCQIIDPKLPKPVIEFIHKFDSGQFPELERQSNVHS